MKMKFSQSQQMLFALLRASLNREPVQPDIFSGASVREWEQCYQLASRQGVSALAWDGILFLPEELYPPRNLKFAWCVAAEQYEMRYRYYCRTVYELSRYYAAHGIATVQLKGTGLSSYYPVPAHREGGDIDIYTYPADGNRMTGEEANRLADQLMELQGIPVDKLRSAKHSVFYYRGIPIENHRTFLNTKNYPMAVPIENKLKEILCPQTISFEDGDYKIQIPSPAFNTLFIAFHAIQHYGCGLALHHVCDWACLLNRYGLHIPPEITDKRFLRTVTALTQITNRLLGTNIPAGDSGILAEEMLREILFPPYQKEVPVKSKAGILVYKTARRLHMLRIRRKVLDESIFRGLVGSAAAHIREPRNIFRT